MYLRVTLSKKSTKFTHIRLVAALETIAGWDCKRCWTSYLLFILITLIEMSLQYKWLKHKSHFLMLLCSLLITQFCQNCLYTHVTLKRRHWLYMCKFMEMEGVWLKHIELHWDKVCPALKENLRYEISRSYIVLYTLTCRLWLDGSDRIFMWIRNCIKKKDIVNYYELIHNP